MKYLLILSVIICFTACKNSDPSIKLKAETTNKSADNNSQGMPDTSFLDFVLGSTKSEVSKTKLNSKIYTHGGKPHYNLNIADATLRCLVIFNYYYDTLAGIQLLAYEKIEGKGSTTIAEIIDGMKSVLTKKYGYSLTAKEHVLGFEDSYWETEHSYIKIFNCAVCETPYTSINYTHKYYHPLYEKTEEAKDLKKQENILSKTSEDL